MTIGPVNASALYGIHRSYEGLRKEAGNIASASTLRGDSAPKVSLERALVQMQEHVATGQANVKSLQTEDQMLGRLLDVCC
jgi:succinylarginine dihydrolase